MQRDDVSNNQEDQHEWQRDNMKRKEAVQCRITDHEVTSDPQCQVITDDRDGTEQGDDHLGTPVRHLPPWQQVTHECFSHQRQVDEHTEQPDELARLFV